MSFFIEDNDLLTDTELKEKRKKIIQKKYNLLQQFRNYVLDYLRKESAPLDVEYDLINNDPNVRFKDLKKAENFTYERICFKFNLQREITTDYFKYRYGLTKLYDKEKSNPEKDIEDVEIGSNLTNSKPRIIRRRQTNLSLIPDFERQKIIERIQLEVDNILRQVFKEEFSFDDPEFEKLVKINAYLEKELREIDKILKPKETDNDFGQKRK